MQLYYIVCINLQTKRTTKVSHVPMSREDCQSRINRVNPQVLTHRSFYIVPA